MTVEFDTFRSRGTRRETSLVFEVTEEDKDDNDGEFLRRGLLMEPSLDSCCGC